MELRNSTQLDTSRLEAMFLGAVAGWPYERLVVCVRYSRGAEFSGTCFYREGRIHVNLGRHNRYPYLIPTHIAKAKSNATHWWRELYTVKLENAYQLALFVFLHEFYHCLVKKARRNVRQKEARCDRFATRALVARYGAAVRDQSGRPVPRGAWDFQDLDTFVVAARRTPARRRGTRPMPARQAIPGSARIAADQLMLFDPPRRTPTRPEP